MGDIDINKIQKNVEELQDQNAIDMQRYEELKQDIEKLKEEIDSKYRLYNLLFKKINSEIEKLKENINK